MHRLLHVGAALDERRCVARSDAVGRFAGAVCGPDQAHPAGGENHRDIAMLHQLLCAFEGNGGHPVDRARGRSGAACRVLDHLCDSRDAFHRRWVRAQDNRATSFERDEDLVDGGGGRIGRRNDGGHDTKRLGDLDHAPILVPGNDADRLHRPDELVHLLRAEQVFLDLVFDDAVSRFFNSESCERFGLRSRRGGHRVDDCVDSRLIEFGDLEPRLLGPPSEGAGFRDRREIAIGWLRRARGFGHSSRRLS